MLRKLCLLVSGLFISSSLFAQSAPAAEGHRPSIWVGASVSTFNPDYGCTNSSPFSCWNHQLVGISPHVDVNHLLHRLGAEGEMRWLEWHGPAGMVQSTYLAGPRYDLIGYRKLSMNIKFLIGDGSFTVPNLSGNYLVYAPGATFDYRLTRRVSARVDYEYQMWPNFHGNASGQGGLTPSGFSFGASYELFR